MSWFRVFYLPRGKKLKIRKWLSLINRLFEIHESIAGWKILCDLILPFFFFYSSYVKL